MTFEHELTEARHAPVPLTGHDVVDAHLAKVGKVTDVIFDDASLPRWAVVKTGFLGAEHFVPLHDAYVDVRGQLVVPFNKADIKRAPRAGGDHVLTREARRALHDYFGIAA